MNVILLPQTAFVGLGDENMGAWITSSTQVRHVTQVLGADVGTLLKIGKMGGLLGTGVIAKICQAGIYLKEIQLTQAPPAKLAVTLVLALPRPKVLRRLIMDMTALGVNHIILVNSYRSDKAYWQSPLLARVDDFILEGLQQGVDTQPPKLTLAKRFKPFVQDVLPSLGDKLLVAHPYAHCSFGDYQAQHGLPDVLLVGAEGGWIDYEIALLQSVGVTAVGLGARILRTEAAVNALLGRWLL